MRIETLIIRLKTWMQKKVTGKVTIVLNCGGIRCVKLEQEIKE